MYQLFTVVKHITLKVPGTKQYTFITLVSASQESVHSLAAVLRLDSLPSFLTQLLARFSSYHVFELRPQFFTGCCPEASLSPLPHVPLHKSIYNIVAWVLRV